MNEVRNTVSLPTAVARPASSPGAVSNQADAETKAIAKAAEVQGSSNAVEVAPKEPVTIEKAVATIQEYVQSLQRDLHFTVDEDLERTVIKVVDGDSGELIRQIPEEAFLELARKLSDQGDFQLFDALG
jgi:flagellar protein FlaG